MPIFALQLKANLVNVTDLQPCDYSDHRWYMKLKCGGCGEISDRWQYATIGETHELTKGHGTCHMQSKCSFCSRQNTLEIIADTYATYSAIRNEEFQTVVKFDCRGLEPVEFEPRVGWKCTTIEKGTIFDDIDLNEGHWVDYEDEPLEISEIESRFVLVKK